MWRSVGNLLFQIFVAFLIGLGLEWGVGISWKITALVLTALVMMNWAIRLPGQRCADLMSSFRDLGRFGVTLALFAVLRILFWSACGFSMIESLSAGQGVGPRGAFNLSTASATRETIIWELLLDGVILVFSFLLAKTVVPKPQQEEGETNA